MFPSLTSVTISFPNVQRKNQMMFSSAISCPRNSGSRFENITSRKSYHLKFLTDGKTVGEQTRIFTISGGL